MSSPFVPSLGWWAAEAYAAHFRTCDISKCTVCSSWQQVPQEVGHRISRAMRRENTFDWVRVASTHEGTDYKKALELLRASTITKNEKAAVRWRADNIERCDCAVNRNVDNMCEHNFLYYVPFLMRSIQYNHVPFQEPKWIFSYLGESALYDKKGEEMLATFIENDILRLTWIPRSSIKTRHFTAEYAHCEYEQLGSAPTRIIRW
jgi:hypothetical protein